MTDPGQPTPPSVSRRMPFGAAGPGFGGYLLAVLITVVTFAVLLGIISGIESSQAGEAVQTIVAVLFFGFYVYIPIGLIGALLVHLMAGRATAQWIQVLLAAAVAFVAGLLFDLVPMLPWLMATSAAIGRACVIPIARRRQSRLAAQNGSVPAVLGSDQAQ